ncbi:hypothetical protein BU16DRAFT_555098 [Lophium mytilinum]|uniref:Transcription factor domain-containing protein n=1 Tax=Lophium mytilinum TaxID=390894 RepID=A0A6A6RFE1_9PEZI|nr:hypothetical protein BU16DRAFT_555098 [Lophium mytilinum]
MGKPRMILSLTSIPQCDSLLPACSNCAKGDLDCKFRDEALQKDIPRNYIQSLNNRIQELSSELALHSHRLPNDFLHTDPTGTTSAAIASSNPQLVHPLHVSVRDVGPDLYLNLSFASRITGTTFGALLLPGRIPDALDAAADDVDSMPNISHGLNRSLLTPKIVRFLLGRYDSCIRPQYDVLETDILNHDGAGFKKLPDPQKFKVLMACAIAAACESYKRPDWKPLAQVCRDWANELVTPIISTPDGDALSATLLLLIYELADSTRGNAWELLDLARRTCLQLGWHRTLRISHFGAASLESGGTAETNSSSPSKLGMISALQDIEKDLQTVFNRPTMLIASKLLDTSDKEALFQVFLQLSDQLYGGGQIFESSGCPFVGEVATLMDLAESVGNQHAIILESWLLFLPVCVNHKQCIHCFQEADEHGTKGMRSLRRKVIDAASQLILRVHRAATAKDDFIPPILASSRALVSGCAIVTSISKRWISSQFHTKDLNKCTDILSMFAPHWPGGHRYLQVWRTIVELLDFEPAQMT